MFAEVPAVGRTFRGTARVRLGDVDPEGRARFDALVRALQDVANDDAHDSGIANPGAWVVRRTVVQVHRAPVLREDLALTTFCSGTGACWAERRTHVTGASGAHVEAAGLWVQLDPVRGTPMRLGPDFTAVYGASSLGRRVDARLRLVDPPPPATAAPRRPFPLRRVDLDVMGHVNNAVAWAMVEEVLGPGARAGGLTVEVEHHRPLDSCADVVLVCTPERLWVLDEHTPEDVAVAARWWLPDPKP